MDCKKRTNRDINSQSKQIIYNVYKLFKKLSNTENLNSNFFKKTQIVTAEACGVSKRSIGKIVAEGINIEQIIQNKIQNSPGSSIVTFESPRNSYKRRKIITDIDDFDKDVVRRVVHTIYDKGTKHLHNLILLKLILH